MGGPQRSNRLQAVRWTEWFPRRANKSTTYEAVSIDTCKESLPIVVNWGSTINNERGLVKWVNTAHAFQFHTFNFILTCTTCTKCSIKCNMYISITEWTCMHLIILSYINWLLLI